MRRLWSADELIEGWSLAPEDSALLVGLPDAGKLGLAVHLAHWRGHGAFPDDEADLAPVVVAHLAGQVGVPVEVLDGYDWAGRTGRRHRRIVLDHLAVTPFDTRAESGLRGWLEGEVLPREPSAAVLEQEIGAWFARGRVVRPGRHRLDRIMRSVRAAHDDAALGRVMDRLSSEACRRLDVLLVDEGGGAAFTRLAGDPGRVGLESLMTELGKLDLVRALALPAGVLEGLHPDLVQRFRRRAGVETAWELRRHPDRIRLPLLALYCAPREGEVVDGLVELLIQITQRITVKAERRVMEELLADATRVRGKAGILFDVARAAMNEPDGTVRDVIFPVAGPDTFEKLLKEAAASGGSAQRAHPHGRARLLRLLLPPHATPAPGCGGVPLEQRRTPPAPRCNRRDPRR